MPVKFFMLRAHQKLSLNGSSLLSFHGTSRAVPSGGGHREQKARGAMVQLLRSLHDVTTTHIPFRVMCPLLDMCTP